MFHAVVCEGWSSKIVSKVALARGDSRRKNTFESLELVEKEIRKKLTLRTGK